MKIAARIFVALLLALAVLPEAAVARPTARPPAAVRPPSVNPSSVNLIEWARANQLQLRWLNRDKTLQLSNALVRFTLTVNSSDAQINGVQTRLSFPMDLRSGVPFASQLDLQKNFGPVLHPPTNPPGSRLKTICLDAGHGGADTGERAGGIEEKKYTLLLAQELGSQLTRAGFNVVMTRTKDVKVELTDRTEIARRRRADLFVCLHFNSSPVDRNEVKGVETYCLTPAAASSSNANGRTGDTRWLQSNGNDEKNLLLAHQLQKSMLRGLPVEDRGVKRARFQVLREATMPAVLIEGGFMSHPAEQKRILDAGYRQQLARAIVDGILAYKAAVKG